MAIINAIVDFEASTTARPVIDEFALPLASGTSCTVLAEDGRPFIDLTAGSGVVNVGYSNAKIIAAIADQAGRLIHAAWQFPTHARACLLRKLASIATVSDARFLFTVTGAEAVEAALKLARLATGRHSVLAFSGSFHGKTIGALDVTASPGLRAGVTNDRTGTLRLPYPEDPALSKFYDRPSDWQDIIGWIDRSLSLTDAPLGEIAGIIVEPVQGGRMVAPPAGFLPALHDLTHHHGLLLIVDEVYTGMGRTGMMFALDRHGIQPDVLAFGKALGAGIPLGVVASKATMAEAVPPYKQTSTFAASPLATAAANAVIDVIQREDLAGNAEQRGIQLQQAVAEINIRQSGIGIALTGEGLMRGLHFLDADENRSRSIACQVRRLLFEDGYLALISGHIIKITPPLTITATEIDHLSEKLERAIECAVAHSRD